MTEIAQFTLPDGGTVLVEVDDVPGVAPVALGEHRVVQAKQTFEAAFAQVRSAGASALTMLTDMPRRPDEVELKFGIKLDAQAGAVIAKTGLQTQFEVKLRWQKSASETREEAVADDACVSDGTAVPVTGKPAASEQHAGADPAGD